MKFKVKNNLLNKAVRNRSHLVPVETTINGRFKTYRAIRWKNPRLALEQTKEDIARSSRKIAKPGDVGFKDKSTDRVVSEKQLVDKYNEVKSEDYPIQNFVKDNYTVYDKGKTETVKESKSPAKEKDRSQAKEYKYNKELADEVAEKVTELTRDKATSGTIGVDYRDYLEEYSDKAYKLQYKKFADSSHVFTAFIPKSAVRDDGGLPDWILDENPNIPHFHHSFKKYGGQEFLDKKNKEDASEIRRKEKGRPAGRLVEMFNDEVEKMNDRLNGITEKLIKPENPVENRYTGEVKSAKKESKTTDSSSTSSIDEILGEAPETVKWYDDDSKDTGLDIGLYSSGRKPHWIAEVTDFSDQYKYERNFLDKWQAKDEAPYTIYELESNTLYNWKTEGETHWGYTKDGQLYQISEDQAKETIRARNSQKANINAEKYKGSIPDQYIVPSDPEKMQTVESDISMAETASKFLETSIIGTLMYGRLRGSEEIRLNKDKKQLEDFRILQKKINDSNEISDYKTNSTINRQWAEENGVIDDVRVSELELKNSRYDLPRPDWLFEEKLPSTLGGLPKFKYHGMPGREEEQQAFYDHGIEVIHAFNEYFENTNDGPDEKQYNLMIRNATLMLSDTLDGFTMDIDHLVDRHNLYMYHYALDPTGTKSNLEATNRTRQGDYGSRSRKGRSIGARKNSFKGERIEPTYSYEKVQGSAEFKDSLKTIKDHGVENFARTTLDILGLDVPLYTESLEDTHGVCRRSESGMLQIAVTTKGRPDHMIRKTTVHEAMHGLLDGTNYHKRFEEPVVELCAVHSANELGEGVSQGMAVPSYANFVVDFAFATATSDMFKGAKGLSGKGGVLMDSIINGTAKDDFRSIESMVTNYSRKLSSAQKTDIVNRYLDSKGLTQEVIAEKYGDQAKQAWANSEGADNPDNTNMAVLITQLQSGGLTLEMALNSYATRGVAFALLCIILEDEDIDPDMFTGDELARILG